MADGSYSSDQLAMIAQAARDAYIIVSDGEPVPGDLVESTRNRLMKALLAAYDAGIDDYDGLVAVAVERIREIDSLPSPVSRKP